MKKIFRTSIVYYVVSLLLIFTISLFLSPDIGNLNPLERSLFPSIVFATLGLLFHYSTLELSNKKRALFIIAILVANFLLYNHPNYTLNHRAFY